MTEVKKSQEASPDPELEAQIKSDELEDETSPQADEEEKESADETSEEEKSADDSSIDYVAELEKEKKRIAQAEHKIIELKKENKALREKDETEETYEESIIDEEVGKKVDEAVIKIRKDMVEDAIEEIIDAISGSQAEKDLIKFHYEHSLKPTGFSRQAIRNDLENAKIMANKSKILKENKELRESLKAKSSISNLSQGTNQNRSKPDETDKYLSKSDLIFLKRQTKGDLNAFEELKKNAIEEIKKKQSR